MNDRASVLSQNGLYDSSFHHDACGVGLTCQLSNEPSHRIVDQGLRILENLEHRGACGCDGTTGDGAGILMQIPDRFFRAQASELGIDLPALGAYGVGVTFLPPDRAQREHCEKAFEEVVRAEGQRVLGWRDVPVRSNVLGAAAADQEPVIRQVFIERSADLQGQDAFERRLYVIRKRIEHQIADSSLSDKGKFHIPSLSAVTLVYKGMLIPQQIRGYFPDLSDEKMESALALVHARFSTNTFPRWSLAQPFHQLCHNGEINTLRGNVNRMRAREVGFKSDVLGEDLDKLHPILDEHGSDSHIVDSALELLCHSGRSLPHAMMMLVPEAWERHEEMSEVKRAFYQYHACLMEPWDGPAKLAFTDGRYLGALLDRNGLRPSRYTVTEDGQVFLASETGVLDVDPKNIREKGRLQPGRMFLVDLHEGRLISDEEIKERVSTQQPYGEWIQANLLTEENLPIAPASPSLPDPAALRRFQQLFGYTIEDLDILLKPMGEEGKEAIGSMGDDTPLAVLSERPRLLYDYFKQLFAQVTNPPLDAIREALVTSLYTYLGAEQNLLAETPEHARRLRLDHPILTADKLKSLRSLSATNRTFRTRTLDTCIGRSEADGEGLRKAMDRLCQQASKALEDGCTLLVLSDRKASRDHLPIPALLALAGVHHHLIREGKRTRCSLIVESGEPREVHHFATLLGYGADAINPYLALNSIHHLVESGDIKGKSKEEATYSYLKALQKGLLKVMSKMGISTLQSYKGAQIFEAVGLVDDVIDQYFTNTASRVAGIGLDEIAEAVRKRHAFAFPRHEDLPDRRDLDPGGRYQWRRGGEDHNLNPLTIAKLQQATRRNEPDAASYAEYARLINQKNRDKGTLRGLLEFSEDASRSVPLDEVEPWTEIVKRFKTGAMSYGSISIETHETIAMAMNAIGGKSNTGEGGEHPSRYDRNSSSRSRIKQVASGRFGVTIDYLTSADEIQIKMAQGAKPGEGGQLPGGKVYPWIADVRQSTPGVALISPPPHHDIYSIEDLAQLIFDLKNSNTDARVTVKLVSEAGVGTIAAGVAKGKADVVLISGHSGGTGASPQTSIMHAGLPWELGLSETHQTLVQEGLRNRIAVECDGQLRTGRDVAVAALLGADEFGFSTAPLVSLGCIMMRKCHLNTCPVGIATQDPELRRKFNGKPQYVINFFHLVAEELRKIMASLGFRTLDEMVGQTDRLHMRDDIEDPESRLLDLTPLLVRPEVPDVLKSHAQQTHQDHGIDNVLDHRLIELARPALEEGTSVEHEIAIRNSDRTLGTMLSSEISKQCGRGLQNDTIVFHCSGSAGQSFAAFGAPGLTFDVRGDANDYFGKGLSGGRLILQPPEGANFVPEDNIIVGNVALYGATSGQAFIRGQAGERFGVRNSGADAVVEGVGDHGCEYMTGGRVVVLGETGRNFSAGMSGGVAYVLDRTGIFAERRCNRDMVDLEPIEAGSQEESELRSLIEQHREATGSTVAQDVLDRWKEMLPRFVKVMPTEYKKALKRIEEGEVEGIGDGSLHEHMVEIEASDFDAAG